TFYPGRYVGNPFSGTRRSSPVDNLIAGGFGTLTADPTPVVTGWGVWHDGTWRVVFARPLAVGRAGNVDLGPDDWTDVAFAVWDGSAQERDGMKSVANFVALDVSPKPMSSAPRFPYWPAPFFVFLALWVVFAWMVVAGLPRSRRA
ncbi:MAG TPA: ethylbenzene dehydrogenase-related protein, partial [Actinomycetota bacterium]|nr:ethylbenzene dehydrogenase-related protein [Actinomycetota bacterium]